MKKIILGLTFILLIISCSSKSTTTSLKCQNIVTEIDNLTKAKNKKNISNAISYVASKGRYAYGQEEDKQNDQKIKVLELKLRECEIEK